MTARSAAPRATANDMRARILQVAEDQCRRLGHHKTSMAGIAADLGISPASLYRFFPSRQIVFDAICHRAVKELADIAFAVALTRLPAREKTERLLTAVHRRNTERAVRDRHMHDMIVAIGGASAEIFPVHIGRMERILETVIREGIRTGEFETDHPAGAARALNGAFSVFLHPALVEHCIRYDRDSETTLRDQIRIVLQALAGRVSAAALRTPGGGISASPPPSTPPP